MLSFSINMVRDYVGLY